MQQNWILWDLHAMIMCMTEALMLGRQVCLAWQQPTHRHTPTHPHTHTFFSWVIYLINPAVSRIHHCVNCEPVNSPSAFVSGYFLCVCVCARARVCVCVCVWTLLLCYDGPLNTHSHMSNVHMRKTVESHMFGNVLLLNRWDLCRWVSMS